MNDHQEELKALIEKYNQEMMAQYASSIVSKPTESAKTETIQDEATPTNHTENLSIDENSLIDTGRLQVRVSTENQAVPIPGAVITVSRQTDGHPQLIRTLIADDNGLTPLVDLPTKDRRLSLEPNHPEPYAIYTVDVTANGYFPKRFIDLPIYGGVTAVQNVSMIPLPENGDRETVLSYPQSGPAL